MANMTSYWEQPPPHWPNKRENIKWRRILSVTLVSAPLSAGGCDKDYHDMCCWVIHTTGHVAAMINPWRPDSARGKKEEVFSPTVGCTSGLGLGVEESQAQLAGRKQGSQGMDFGSGSKQLPASVLICPPGCQFGPLSTLPHLVWTQPPLSSLALKCQKINI